MKKNIVLFGFILVLISIIYSQDLPEGSVITETNLYVSKVDNLRIRETPDINGKVIGKIMRFEEVEYQNETSSNITEIMIEDQKVSAPWIKIETINNIIGWVWKGFIYKVYTFKDNKLQYQFQILSSGQNEYCNYLDNLEVNKNITLKIERNMIINDIYREIETNENIIIDDNLRFSNQDADYILFSRNISFQIKQYTISIIIHGPQRMIAYNNLDSFIITSIEDVDFTNNLLPLLINDTEKNIIINSYSRKNLNYYEYTGNAEYYDNYIKNIFIKKKFKPNLQANLVWDYLSKEKFIDKLKNNQITGIGQEWYDIGEYIIKTIKKIK